MKIDRKPDRGTLLRVIEELQVMIGKANALHANDRDANGFEKGQEVLEKAFCLCVNARRFDPPARRTERGE